MRKFTGINVNSNHIFASNGNGRNVVQSQSEGRVTAHVIGREYTVDPDGCVAEGAFEVQPKSGTWGNKWGKKWKMWLQECINVVSNALLRMNLRCA